MSAAADRRRVAANGLSLLGAYVLPRVFTAGSVVFAARALGTESFGVYGAAAAYAVILSLLATLGMQPLLVRDLAREPRRAPGLLRAAHSAKTIANVVMLATLYLVAGPVGGLDPTARAAALWLGVGYAIGAYAENVAAYFQAIERMHVWAEASALSGIVTGGLGVLAVWLTSSVIWFCAASTVGQAAALFWLILRLPPEVRRGAPAGREDVATLFRAVVPFAAAFIALSVFYKVDVILMQHWRAAHDVGLYTAAYKFVDIYQALVLVGIAALYPRLARSAPNPDRALEMSARWGGTRITELALLLAVPIAGVLHLAARPAVTILFGGEYAEAASAVSWLALALPPLALNLLAGYLLGATSRIGWMALAYGAGIVIKVSLDAVLIPRFGPQGAAVGMVAAETMVACATVVALRRHAQVMPGARAMVGALGAVLLLVGARALSGGGVVLVGSLFVAGILVLYGALGLLRAAFAHLRMVAPRRPAVELP